jgi:hypothetical protein
VEHREQIQYFQQLHQQVVAEVEVDKVEELVMQV